jgi:hypothetical protein
MVPFGLILETTMYGFGTRVLCGAKIRGRPSNISGVKLAKINDTVDGKTQAMTKASLPKDRP